MLNPNEIIKNYLNYIDNGKFYKKPFSFLYALFAVLNILTPFSVLIYASSNNLFDMGGDFVAAFMLIWLILIIVGIIGFLIWWQRKDQVSVLTSENDDFVAVPIVAHFIQTFGEWAGTYFGILGFAFALLGRIFLGNSLYSLRGYIGVDFLGTEVVHIFLMPLFGFGFIVFCRFLAEVFSSFTIIANNTKIMRPTEKFVEEKSKAANTNIPTPKTKVDQQISSDDIFK